MKETVIDIWGSCVSRDIFGIAGEKGFRISNFFQGCPFYAQFSGHSGPDISMVDFEDIEPNLVNFYKKCTIADYNKTLTETLDSSGAEWIIVDLRYMLYNLVRMEYCGEIRNDRVYEYVSASYVKYLDQILSKKGIQTVKHIITPDCVDFTDSFDKFTDYLIKRYQDHIILIETLESFEELGPEGELINQWRSEKYLSILAEYNYRFLRDTGAFYVKCPYNVVADSLHKWKTDRVHYISEYYGFAKRSVEYIVGSTDSIGIKQRNLDLMYAEACSTISKIRSGVIDSVNNTLMRIRNNYAAGNDKVALEHVYRLVEQGCPEAYGYLGRACRDGKALEKNLEKAEEYLIKAAQMDIGWARLDAFDLLWQKHTAKDDSFALEIIKPLVERKNEHAIQRMGRAYRDGRGVDKDLTKAADQMRYAVEKNIGWARIELFDILLSMGDSVSLNEAVEIIEKYASEGNGNALGRLARLYWKGIGVEKNLDKAEELMKKSADKGIVWAKSDYDSIKAENSLVKMGDNDA